MRNLFLLSLLTILFIKTLAGGLDSNIDKFNSVLNSYIDSLKSNTVSNGKYVVIVANLYSLQKSKFCFSLEYICNDWHLDNLAFYYVYYFHNEIVLVKMSAKDERLIEKLHLKKFDNADSKKIKDKLLPLNEGVILRESNGYEDYCIEHNKIKRSFYKDTLNQTH